MFKSKSLNFRLRASFGALIAILVVTGIVNIRLQKMTEEYNSHVNKVNLPNAVALGDMDSNSNEIFKRLLQFSLKGNTEEDLHRIGKVIDESIKAYEESSKKYEAVTFVEGEAELYDKVSSNWKLMLPLFLEMDKLGKSGSPDDHAKLAEMYRKDLKASRDAFTLGLDNLIKFQIGQSEKWSKMAEETSAMADKVTIFAMVIGTLFGTVIAFSISASLTKQLTELTTSLTEGADTVAKAADNIAHSSEELSSAVNEQAAAIQETTASTEELSAMVKKNQENAVQSNAVSKESAASATDGKRTIEEMITAIGDIDKSNQKMMTTVEANNNNISEIIQVIHEISNKTKVINEIVFQTKLLSFNASVEAARAGEQGKGFAVVAEEVGNLAQMSGTAAQEISDMLGTSIAKVESIVNQTKSEVSVLMVEGKNKVEHGINVARRCNDVLDVIVGHVSEVDSMVGEITVASDEQSKGISEISRAMGQLDQATQINADSSRQMAASSEELSGQARKLNELVVDLKHTVEGRIH